MVQQELPNQYEQYYPIQSDPHRIAHNQRCEARVSRVRTVQVDFKFILSLIILERFFRDSRVTGNKESYCLRWPNVNHKNCEHQLCRVGILRGPGVHDPLTPCFEFETLFVLKEKVSGIICCFFCTCSPAAVDCRMIYILLVHGGL